MSTARVGVVVAPRYFDTTAQELQWLVPAISVLHNQMRLGDDFDYQLAQMPGTAGEVETCARELALAGADVVIQLATPFSSVHGWDGGRAIQHSISERIGVPFEMMGLAVPAALHALDTRRIALASTYYPLTWTQRYREFVADAGLEVVGGQDFFDQGLHRDPRLAWEQSFVGFEPELIIDSIIEVGAAFADAEAVLVPGMPARLVAHLSEAEAQIDKPIVSYHAIWWRCLSHLGLRPTTPAGVLLDRFPDPSSPPETVSQD